MSIEFEYRHDAVTLTGRLATGSGSARRPGVVLFHEGGGLGPHTVERAERLAGAGYVALAADMYGPERGEYGETLTVEQSAELMAPFFADPLLLRGRALAALEALRGHPECDPRRIAVVGYCFGGMVALEVARSGADIDLAAAFHGILSTVIPAQRGEGKAKVLVCTGSEDVFATAAARTAFEAEMTDAGVDWEMVVYGGVKHSFTNPTVDALDLDDFRYDAAADRRSWALLLGTLEEVFRKPPGDPAG